MRVGIGLPSAVPGTAGPLIVQWARQADAGPFASLAVLDRLTAPKFLDKVAQRGSFLRNFPQGGLSVHGLQEPAFGLTGLSKRWNKFRGPAAQGTRRKICALKCGLPKMPGGAVHSADLTFPAPHVICSDRIGAQLDLNFLAFHDRHRVQPGQKNLAVYR